MKLKLMAKAVQMKLMSLSMDKSPTLQLSVILMFKLQVTIR
jgi:hypothetical protein